MRSTAVIKPPNTTDSIRGRLDKAIDTAVYGLYGLTEEEIKVVEGE